ncbi:MAG: hypothetical protein MUE97_04690, partial [Phycisphaerales bacterium]|nr:hypothetical protein [Phycisphaerales bacterium]
MLSKQASFELRDDTGRQDVLDLVGIAIDMISRDLGLLDEEQLPQAVGADDAGGLGLAMGCERPLIAVGPVGFVGPLGLVRQDQPGALRSAERAHGHAPTRTGAGHKGRRVPGAAEIEVVGAFERFVDVAEEVLLGDATAKLTLAKPCGQHAAAWG